MIRPVAILMTLAGIVIAGEANAQGIIRRGFAQPVATYPASSTPGVAGPVTYAASYTGPATPAAPGRTYTYSYYTLSPLPPRTYVGYGADEFPFHGVRYGHPYDPWTWPMMSGSYGNGLARYYDPPVK